MNHYSNPFDESAAAASPGFMGGAGVSSPIGSSGGGSGTLYFRATSDFYGNPAASQGTFTAGSIITCNLQQQQQQSEGWIWGTVLGGAVPLQGWCPATYLTPVSAAEAAASAAAPFAAAAPAEERSDFAAGYMGGQAAAIVKDQKTGFSYKTMYQPEIVTPQQMVIAQGETIHTAQYHHHQLHNPQTHDAQMQQNPTNQQQQQYANPADHPDLAFLKRGQGGTTMAGGDGDNDGGFEGPILGGQFALDTTRAFRSMDARLTTATIMPDERPPTPPPPPAPDPSKKEATKKTTTQPKQQPGNYRTVPVPQKQKRWFFGRKNNTK